MPHVRTAVKYDGFFGLINNFHLILFFHPLVVVLYYNTKINFKKIFCFSVTLINRAIAINNVYLWSLCFRTELPRI